MDFLELIVLYLTTALKAPTRFATETCSRALSSQRCLHFDCGLPESDTIDTTMTGELAACFFALEKSLLAVSSDVTPRSLVDRYHCFGVI
jgi:hypothetical protein